MQSSSAVEKYFLPCVADFVFDGHSFVLPSLGIGNCAQLAIDLIINTFELRKVGYLNDIDVIPMVGHIPEGGLITNLEVFQDPKRKLVFLQQRAPVLKNKNHAFAKRLIAWAKARFSRVLVLASVDSARRVLAEQFLPLDGQPLVRYFASDSSLTVDGWQPFEENSFHDAFKSTSFTRRVTEECHEAQVPVLVLTVFCAAGMTVPHAIKLAEGVVHFAEAATTERQVTWKWPISWLALLHDEADLTSLYG